MKIKVLSFLGLIILCSNLSFAQSQDCQQVLEAVYGVEKMSNLTSQSETASDYLCFKNTHGYYLSEVPGEKMMGFPDVLELNPLVDGLPALTLDVLEGGIVLAAYGIEIESKHYQYFSIGNSDKLLVVYPNSLIESLFENP